MAFYVCLKITSRQRNTKVSSLTGPELFLIIEATGPINIFGVRKLDIIARFSGHSTSKLGTDHSRMFFFGENFFGISS